MTKTKIINWIYCLFFTNLCLLAANSNANQSSFNEQLVILEKGSVGDQFGYPQAFDQALSWNSCSSAVCPSIDFGFVDDEDRDHQVLEVSHAETTAGAGIFISSSDAIDMSGSLEGGIYQLDLKVISGDPEIVFKVDCGYPCVGGDQYVTVAEQGVWETFSVPVADLPNGPNGNHLDLEIIKGGLVIQATQAYGTVFRVDNVIWKCVETCEQNQMAYEPVDWASNHEDISYGYDAPTSYDGYTQVWADEFSGNLVDYQKWGFDIGNGDNGWGNGELQYYREENATVDNGMLIIEAKKHQPALSGGITFTSAKLTTADKFHFKYGRVDVRAVVAEGQGLWSSAWMLGANHSQIGWPRSGEIDIVDTIGGVRDGIPQEGMIVNNMYWNATGPNPSEPYSPANINLNGSAEYRINDFNEGETFSNKFHVFSMIWDEDKIQFQVDGVDTESVNLTNKLADTFRNPFYLILNVAVGGAWPGSPGDNINFPDGMLVDYVRVYQKDNDGDGVADYGDYDIFTNTELDPPQVDIIQPIMESVNVVNKCNHTNIIGLDDTIIINVLASESIMKPEVSVAGHSVTMTGQHHAWSGEFKLQEAPTRGEGDSLTDPIKIPVVISYMDNSGNAAETYTVSGEGTELEFCEQDCVCFPEDISGEWRLAQKAGAIGVGRAEGSISDWSSTNFTLTQRECQFDDSYTFSAADPFNPTYGVFTQDMGDSTWYETWQPAVNPLGYEHCNTPYPPFDGSTPGMTYEWDIGAGTLTLNGLGAHIGLPRVANLVDNMGEDIESVTYKIETASENFIALNILGAGPSPWWHFELERVTNTNGSSVSEDFGDDSDALFYGEKGPFDMTGAYGDAVIDGNNGDLFRVPSDGVNGFAGYANQGEAKNLYPLTFGDGGTLTFSASIPEGQAVTEADVVFMFEKQESESGSFCETNPRYETLPITVSGFSNLTYTIEIPAQGANTFSSFIMRLVDEDVQVRISDVMVTTTAPAEGEPDVSQGCGPSTEPSVFPDENGVNTAGYFTGVYGGENGGVNTLQSGDVFTFPTESASYGGFANDNTDLYPLTFNEFLNGSPLITFCASSDSVANVFFQLENNPWPANGTIKESAHIEIAGDGVIRAYTSSINLSGPVQAWNSFLMFIEERDVPVTIGKIKGNWNGNNSPDLTGYCDDFTSNSGGNNSGGNPVQNSDTDGDGYDNTVDAFPHDSSEWLDTDLDGIGNNADNDDDGDGIFDWEDSAPMDASLPSQMDAQIISVLGNPVGLVGKSTTVDIGYDVSNGNNQTTGLGLRVHYDSSVLQVNDVMDVLPQDLIVDATGPLPDTENYDNDYTTDVFYSLGWASLFGNWPNQQLAVKLMTFDIQVKEQVDIEVTQSTPINFSPTAIAAGYEFNTESYDLELLTATWDFDGNGQADALTDGLILLRYAFGLRGNNLIDGVMSMESNMSASEVELAMQNASAMADIDLDGEVGALTDGLLLLRYLFGLGGESLINGVVSLSALRTSIEDITDYLDRYMPRMENP